MAPSQAYARVITLAESLGASCKARGRIRCKNRTCTFQVSSRSNRADISFAVEGRKLGVLNLEGVQTTTTSTNSKIWSRASFKQWYFTLTYESLSAVNLAQCSTREKKTDTLHNSAFSCHFCVVKTRTRSPFPNAVFMFCTKSSWCESNPSLSWEDTWRTTQSPRPSPSHPVLWEILMRRRSPKN